MKTKHEINYTLIFTVLTLISLFAVLLVIVVFEEGFLGGVFTAIIFIAAIIFSISQLFVPQRIKSVTVASTEIIIEYRKTTINVPFESFKKITHEKHGPLTERIYVYAGGYFYDITFDLKHFHEMCKEIYDMLLSLNMESVADEWFQKKYGKEATIKDSQCINQNSNNVKAKYSANYRLMWALMILQFIFVLFLTIVTWNRADIIFKIIWPITVFFIEYLGVLAITSPKLTRSVTITANGIVIEFKKERIEIPFASCERIQFRRPWPHPKRVYVFIGEKQFILLPWYIKNFRGLCRSIYQALENVHMESIADKSFRKKFGK